MLTRLTLPGTWTYTMPTATSARSQRPSRATQPTAWTRPRRRDAAGACSELAVHLRPVLLRPRLEGCELQQHRRLCLHPAAGVRAAGSSKPTTYPDETTSYYWAVLPAIGMNGSLATGDPLAASPQSLSSPRRLLRRLRRMAPRSSCSRPSAGPVEGARRYRSRSRTIRRVRLVARRRAHRLDGVHEQHLLPGRHDPLLARPRRRREPDRPGPGRRSGPSGAGCPRRY